MTKMTFCQPGPDTFEVVPDSQLVVARHASKNNSSKYTINGRQSSFTGVRALLKGRGIDLDTKRFLILQVSITKLQHPRHCCQLATVGRSRVIAHEDGLLEKMYRLQFVEREKNALEDQKKDAENYLRIYNKHVRAQSRLWRRYLLKCAFDEEELNRKVVRIYDCLRIESGTECMRPNRIAIDLAAEREQHNDDVGSLPPISAKFLCHNNNNNNNTNNNNNNNMSESFGNHVTLTRSSFTPLNSIHILHMSATTLNWSAININGRKFPKIGASGSCSIRCEWIQARCVSFSSINQYHLYV